MSHRNLLVLLTAIVVSYTCHVRADRSLYGRYLAQVLDAIDRESLTPVTQSDLFEGAMHGIVSTLHERGDVHSGFVSARDAADFEAELEQEFGGVGVMIRLEGEDDNLSLIVHPLAGTPAFKAGIRARDRILQIDGADVAQMTIDDIKHRMRGAIGEPVELTVLHEGETTTVTITIVRDTINVPSVLGDRRLADGGWDLRLAQDRRIAYLRITSFANKTVSELDEALATVTSQRAEALIIDLRDNPGGALDVATEMTDRFITGGKIIVSIRGRDGHSRREFVSTGQGTWLDMPMAVLVNGNSASASEIFAACLQDYDRAVIVGERTYGKGTIQQVLPIESGRSILKLTTASYWRPSGRNIHRASEDTPADDDWGVVPNDGFVVTLSSKEEEQLIDARRRALYDDGNGPPEPPPADASPDKPAPADPPPTDPPPTGEAPSTPSSVDRQLQKAVEYLQGRLE